MDRTEQIYLEQPERNVQVDPVTGKRKRGRPRGSGKHQRNWVQRVVFSKGVYGVLPVHIVSEDLEDLFQRREIHYIEIRGRLAELVLFDGSRVRMR